MKPDTPLDYAVFQLTPTRTRCELIASAGDESEKLASGLIEPFQSHIKEVNDQIVKGSCSIKLQPPPGNGDGFPAWFTKGTLERFVRFVNNPEALERVCSIEDELLQLEETLKHNNGMSDELHPGTPSSHEQEASVESNGQTNSMKAMELRRSNLYKEQALAFAGASSAGFIPENIPSLIEFAQFFGASRLQEACEKYMKLVVKKREREVWLEDSNDSPRENGLGNWVDGGAGALGPSDTGGELLSFKEKLSMFEGKKSRAFDKRRKSAELVRTEPQKPVLRRWSLAVEKFPQLKEGEGEHEAKEKVNTLHEEDAEHPEETPEPELQEDHKSVSSESQDPKGSFYEQYRERRDAKLREETSSIKAEKQAKLVAMQETLDRRRAEVAKSLRMKKSDPLAEARVRAEKLRVFKAGLAEMKKAKEEEERKRLEELRIQRQQKKVGGAPGSPNSPGKAPRGLFPTFQRSSSIGTRAAGTPGAAAAGSNRMRRNWSVVSQSVPCLQELKQQENESLRLRKTAVIKSSRAASTRSSVSSGSSSSSSKVRNAVVRKSVSHVERDEGLKSLGIGGGGEGLMFIRAPVSAAEEEKGGDGVGDENEGESTGGESEAEGYNAPVAPISVSPMVVNV